MPTAFHATWMKLAAFSRWELCRDVGRPGHHGAVVQGEVRHHVDGVGGALQNKAVVEAGLDRGITHSGSGSYVGGAVDEVALYAPSTPH